jgi:excisionase family DNA binding protein
LLLSPDKARRLADPPIGRDAMYELLRNGRIRSVSIGRKRLIPVAEMCRWIETELENHGVES